MDRVDYTEAKRQIREKMQPRVPNMFAILNTLSGETKQYSNKISDKISAMGISLVNSISRELTELNEFFERCLESTFDGLKGIEEIEAKISQDIEGIRYE